MPLRAWERRQLAFHRRRHLHRQSKIHAAKLDGTGISRTMVVKTRHQIKINASPPTGIGILQTLCVELLRPLVCVAADLIGVIILLAVALRPA